MTIHDGALERRVAFGDVLADIHWQPGRDTVVALGSYVLVVAAMYLAFQVFTTARVAANFLTFGPLALGLLGVGLPLYYTVVVRRQPLSELGLTTARLLPSLLLSLVLGWDVYRNTLGPMSLAWTRELVPLIAMTSAVGLFEAIFFRGWLQMRFEAAFGLVPGLLLGALCYSLYHVGYGMEAQELLTLFFLGVTFGAMFRLTRNVIVLWPFYTPVGGLYSNLGDGLALPFAATYGFVLIIALMAGLVLFASRISKRRLTVEGSK